MSDEPALSAVVSPEPAPPARAAAVGTVALGYAVVAYVFAVAMCRAGFPSWLPVAMCVFVYAGASQFAALSLLSGGAPVGVIVLGTLMVNLRHLMMSVYMAIPLAGLGATRAERWLYGWGLTDESFAVHSEWLRIRSVRSIGPLIRFNIICHLAWITGSVIGVASVAYIGQLKSMRLDYALTAMMIFVFASLCRDRSRIFAAAVAVLVAWLLQRFGASVLNPTSILFIATLLACFTTSWMKHSISR